MGTGTSRGEESQAIDSILTPGASAQVGGYTVKNTGGGVLTCTCPAWRFRKGVPVNERSCKHLQQHFGAAEAARISGDLGAPGRSASALGCGAAESGAAPRSEAPTGARAAAAAGAGRAAAAGGGGPAPGFSGVLLAKKWELGKVDPTGWLMSEKLDGMRGYWDGHRLLSRTGNEVRCPDAGLGDELPAGFPLDGELFLGRGRFQELMSVIKNGASGVREWAAVRYVVFDAPAAPGGFEARLEAAERRLAGNLRVRVHPHALCESLEHLSREQKRVEELGGEGLMLRRPGSAYCVGRDASLLKVKSFSDDEAVVVAHEPGKGRNAGVLGALRCRSRAGVTFCVGAGFSDAQRRDPPRVGEVVTYRYQELTRDGVPRFPSFVGVRADVDASGLAAPASSSGAAPAGRSSAPRPAGAPGRASAATAGAACAPPRRAPAPGAAGALGAAGGGGAAGAAPAAAGNAELADVFDEMAVVHGIKGDRIRRMAYSRAADALRRHPAAILSGSEAQAIQGVGAGMARRLDEVLETGELKELAELRQDPVVISVRELRSVYGIGPKFAAELMEKHGVHSLAQLRESVEAGSVTLSAVQRVGLRLADELRIRIPRAEAQEIEVAILHARDSLAASVDGPQDLVVVICGSYRRGKAECGDIDCLITSDTYTSNSAIPRLKQATSGDLLTRFVNALRANSLITDDLASGPSKYMGVCKLPGPGRLHRRLDIRYIPRDQFYFGMLYFTGPRSLSIDMRLRAIEKGMVLNEYCLASKDDPDDRVLVGSERQIFEALQVPYKEPHER